MNTCKVEIQQYTRKGFTWGQLRSRTIKREQLELDYGNAVKITYLCHRLGSFRDGVLGEFTRQNEAYRSLDLSR